MSLTCTTYHRSSVSVKGLFVFLVLLCFLLAAKQSKAQNLFVNAGFEDQNVCTEYNAPCVPEAWFYLKPTTNIASLKGPRPLLGKQVLLLPVWNVFDTVWKGPFVYTMLACPLVKADKYKLSFYMNSLGKRFNNVDFYFCDSEPLLRNFSFDNINPTFSIDSSNIVADMKQGWKAIEYYFTATGNERFCIVGNLSQKMNFGTTEKMNAAGDVLYFLDEIKLTVLNNKPPCMDYSNNISKLYNQNYRHTDFVLIDSMLTTHKKIAMVTDTINLPSFFFETNSAILKIEVTKMLDSIVDSFSGENIIQINITGFTDNSGSDGKNIALSLNRANAVKDVFLQRFPKYAGNIYAYGKGKEQPVASNGTVIGRSKNRRVEIVFTIQAEAN